jgi:hypothetical protein
VAAQNRRISAPRRGPARRVLRRAPAPSGPPMVRHGRERVPADDLSGPHAVEMAGLLHELAARLLGAESFAEAVERLAAFGAEAVPGAVRCSVALIGEGGPATITGAGPAAATLDEIEYATSTGPGLESARTRALVTSPNLLAEARWPDLTSAAVQAGAHSVVAVPLDIQRDSVGALSVYADTRDGVTPPVLLTVMAIANQAEVLLGAIRRRDTLLENAAVDRAAGVLIAQRNCGVDEAYAFVNDTAERLGLDRRTVADRLIAAATRKP